MRGQRGVIQGDYKRETSSRTLEGNSRSARVARNSWPLVTSYYWGRRCNTSRTLVVSDILEMDILAIIFTMDGLCKVSPHARLGWSRNYPGISEIFSIYQIKWNIDENLQIHS